MIYGCVLKTELRSCPDRLNVSVRERKKLQMNPRLLIEQIRKMDLLSEMRKPVGAIG